MQSIKQSLKLGIGILISLVFMYLAIKKADLGQVVNALKGANYWYLLPAIAILFFSHWLRALRWRYLLDPIRRLDTKSLFSSLIIGYMANIFTPAHLGEFLRAYVLSKKRDIPMGSTFATIVVERIIDVFSLLVVLLLVIFIHPFPDWVVKSGYIMLFGALVLFLFLIVLKKQNSKTQSLVGLILKPLPERFRSRMEGFIERFVEGIVPLKTWYDYIIVVVLSMAIWACYSLGFYFCLHGFEFIGTFNLPWYVSLVLLAITTISIIVPSSPGYVGTYHYLCQLSLAMFAVPSGPALSYAVVVHGVNFVPVLVVGVILANYEGMRILRFSGQEKLAESAPPTV
jgi:hypothetical protein